MPSKGFTHPRLPKQYDRLLADISGLLEQARHTAVRSVNAVLTSAYWQIGRRIVEHEQGGKQRAGYGEELLIKLSEDLIAMHGRGFSGRNLRQMRAFYLGWEIWQTPSAKFETRVICSSLSSKLSPAGPPTTSGQSIFLQTPSCRIKPSTNSAHPVLPYCVYSVAAHRTPLLGTQRREEAVQRRHAMGRLRPGVGSRRTQVPYGGQEAVHGRRDFQTGHGRKASPLV